MKDDRKAKLTKKTLEKLLDQVRKTSIFYPTPPPHFDARTASYKALDHFGIPRKPDKNKLPHEYAFWWEMFSPPTTFIPLQASDFFFPIPFSFNFNPRYYLPASATRHERSRNWSGAYLTATEGETFTHVHGLWQVPDSSLPASAGGAADRSKYRSSTWIGLDGQRQYLNSSLPQIGTSQCIDVVTGQGVALAWWQWWARPPKNQPPNPPTYLPLPVKPMDLIMCSLRVVDPSTVKFLIKNKTTGHILPPFIGTAPPGLHVSGATAEWILERPSKPPNPTDYYELPNYNTAVFSKCLAVSNSGREHRLLAARFINMFEVPHSSPNRTTNISVANWIGPREVDTVYAGA